MDRSKFTDESPGRLVQVPQLWDATKTDWAFIPNLLPPAWEFDPSLTRLLVDASAQLGRLQGAVSVLPSPRLLVQPLHLQEAISSSRIEGTIVTPRQLVLFQVDSKEVTSHDERKNEVEVDNDVECLRIGHSLSQQMPIGDHLVKTMHATLMRGLASPTLTPGDYRVVQAHIGTNSRFIPPPAGEVRHLLANLFEYLRAAETAQLPLVNAFIAHYQFEAIHPFQDGNGRVGRALLAISIARALGHSMPWLYLSSYLERNRQEYVELLFNVSARGDWKSWIAFCLQGTIEQAEDAIIRCNAFDKLKRRWMSKAGSMKRMSQLVDLLLTKPALTVPLVQEALQVKKYETARKDIERLVELGIVQELPDTTPRTFICGELMRIAFTDDLESLRESDQTTNDGS